MLSDLGKRNVRYVDHDADMSGVCQSCKTVVECKRRDCVGSKGPQNAPDPAIWSDLLCAECPHCKARVFVLEKQALAPLVVDPPQPGKMG